MSTSAKYPTKKSGPSGKNDKNSISIPLVTVLNLALFALSLYFYLVPKYPVAVSVPKNFSPEVPSSADVATSTVIKAVDMNSVLKDTTINEPSESEACDDPVWCTVLMPSVSYFKFEPPSNAAKWRRAQIQAAKGEQVLLARVRRVFPSHNDFLDGDITFRKLHSVFDFFVDEHRDLSPLRRPGAGETFTFAAPSRRLKEGPTITAAKMVNGHLQYPWEAEGKRVIPDPYNFRAANRSAVVSIGYTAYTRDQQTYFSGNRIGGAFIDRALFFKYWKAVRDDIDLPFIAICSLNENWGFISTNFPNRTAGWGQCCNTPRDRDVLDFLNHDKTLMLATNQHFNLSHPKLISLPRGLPLTWGSTRVIVWDAMRNTLQIPKNRLLFAAASSWGPRPQILRCISKKISPADFDGHVNTPVTNRLGRDEYYKKLGTARFGLCLPGLGYDTFRAWELMTMGTIAVLERAVGFDRTMWRLPALFVEDFDEITPELLRTAYVEALYRADDFEFERLTQSFWYGVIGNVSATMSLQTLLDKFPMEAELPRFSRPRVPYECGKTDTCGKGTNRTPRSSC